MRVMYVCVLCVCVGVCVCVCECMGVWVSECVLAIGSFSVQNGASKTAGYGFTHAPCVMADGFTGSVMGSRVCENEAM